MVGAFIQTIRSGVSKMADFPAEIEATFESPEERRRYIARKVLEREGRLPETLEDIEAMQWEGLLPAGAEETITQKVTSPAFTPSAEAAEFGAEPRAVAEDPERLFKTAPVAAPSGVSGFGAGLGALRMPSTEDVEQAMQERQESMGQQEEALTTGYQELRGAQEALGLEHAEAAQAKAGLMAENLQAREIAEISRQRREQERQNDIRAEIGKVRDQMNEIQTSGVDPLNWYKHPDGSNNYAKSVLSAIAVMFGFLGKKRGGQNAALQIINKAIDRDIDAQKTNLRNRRAGLGSQMNLLGRMQSMLNNERAADTATRLIANKTAQMKIEQKAAEYASPLAEGQANLLVSALNNEETKLKNKLYGDLYNQRVLDESAKYTVEAQQVAAQQKARAAAAAAMAKGAPPPMPPGMEILDPNRRMPSEKIFGKAIEVVGAYEDVSTKLKNLLQWRLSKGAELAGGDLVKANSMLRRTKAAMRHLDKAGANLSDNEIEMMGLNFEMGDLGWIRERLESLIGSVTQKTSSTLKPMNIRLGSQPTAGARRRQ